MASPLAINVQQAAKAVPVTYTVPGSTEIEPLSAFARYDGAAASGPWMPCMTFYSPGGLVLARVFPEGQLAIGDTADVTYSPALNSSVGDSSATTLFKLIAAGTTNSTLVRAGGTSLVSYFMSNLAASPRFVKLYDKATAPTVGTDTPKWTIMIPPASGANIGYSEPLDFTLGLGIGITGGYPDNDTTAVTAGDVIVNLGYQ